MKRKKLRNHLEFVALLRTLGGATGEEVLITEVKASSSTSSGLFGLNSTGVSKSTLPESTRESRSFVAVLEPAGTLLLAGVGVSKPMGRPPTPPLLCSTDSDANRAFVV